MLHAFAAHKTIHVLYVPGSSATPRLGRSLGRAALATAEEANLELYSLFHFGTCYRIEDR